MSLRSHFLSPRQIFKSFKRFNAALLLVLAFFTIVPHLDADQGPVPDWNLVGDAPFNLISPPGVSNPVLKASDVTDVSAQFVADPFLFHENNQWYLFFEVLNTGNNRGEIGVAVSNDGLSWHYDRIVLAEQIHLSFPFVFKYLGEYYMMPETAGFNEVRLYKAKNFPYGWQYYTTLVKGRGYADPQIFKLNGTWWLFSGVKYGDPNLGNCFLFYSDNLLTGWVEHPKSPIIVKDLSKSRPGGRSFVFDNGRIIRLVQKNDLSYGEKLRAFEVDVLTKTSYGEHEIAQSPILSKTGDGWNADGMHHFDPWWTGDQWLCSVDGIQGDIWSIGIYVTPVPGGCPLDSRFQKATLFEGVMYYTDRDYTLTSVPGKYLDMDIVMTPNDERDRSDVTGYLAFEMPFDGTVYVAFDSRATSVPNWMSGFTLTGDRIYTSLSSQPYLNIYSRGYHAGECVNFGANKASGFSGNTVSNYFVYYGKTESAPTCVLEPKFQKTTLASNIPYYTDRTYTLRDVPPEYIGLALIKTPNDELNFTTSSGYLKFEMPADGKVFVAYDRRTTSLPSWMSGFTYTGKDIFTSLASQDHLKVYSKTYFKGDCVDLGANYATGSSGEYRSNYIVFYGEEGTPPPPPACTLDAKFQERAMQAGAPYYTDRDYTITGGIPTWMVGRTLIRTSNDERLDASSSGYLRFTNPDNWWVYVLFDSRAGSPPSWLNGWELRSDIQIKTSLSSQPYLKTYRKQFDAGQCVDLGGNYGPGSSSENRSNYVVVYGQ